MLHLTDETGTEVEADVFGELLERGNITINVSTHKSTGEISLKYVVHFVLSILLLFIYFFPPVVLDMSPSPMGSPKSDISILTSPSPGTSSASDSDSTVIIRNNGGQHTEYERQKAKQVLAKC